MNKIKLVIWDLDETFWKGTLSEEGIEVIEKNILIIRELTNRGIINSIVSKNDFTQAKHKLIELGIWDLFVFPAIEWTPKGVLIKSIIEKCQLRDVNVLFLDDNHLNLEEAKFYNPNLHVKLPDFINQIIHHKAFKGKDDSVHSRLKQYKLLENKSVDRANYSSNIQFLESSNIRIEYLKDLSSHKDRLYELLERTNQLNYTKIRTKYSDLDSLIDNPNLENVLIRIIDDYGDYGIVGFYSYERISHNLLHFVFSCRIMNLGVPQLIYSELNFPNLEIVPEIAVELDNSKPTWIKEIQDIDKLDKIKFKNTSKKLKVFFKGGCDLSQMTFYLQNHSIDIKEETNYVSKENVEIHQEHSQIIIDSLEMDKSNQKFLLDNVPFVDDNFFNTKIFDFKYDVLIYSVLMDYTQDIYVHKNRDIKLPYGGYYQSWTNPENHPEILEIALKRKKKSITSECLNLFKDEFINIGQITTSDFIKNLKKIRKIIPNKIPIIFINGTELKSPNPLEINAKERHKAMNIALEKLVKGEKNCYILDVRNVINNENKIYDNIRHYSRKSYKNLSIELVNLLKKVTTNDIKKSRSILKPFLIKKDLIGYVKKIVKALK